MIAQMTVKEAAQAMGKTEQFIRIGLQQNRFPWGYAVKMGGEHSYFINKKKFQEVEGYEA